MTNVDLPQMKDALLAVERRHRERTTFHRVNRLSDSGRTKSQRAIGNMFETAFAKAGLDTAKVKELLAEDQIEFRRRVEKEKIEAANHAMSVERAVHQTLEAQYKTLGLLPKPHLSYLQVLDKPGLILENRGPAGPDLDIYFDSHIESLNSWIKFRLDTNRTNLGSGTTFTFYFVWTNPYDFPAAVSATTSLNFNGFGDVSAAPGLFSGHENWLSLSGFLAVLRWSGWGADPVTGQSLDQTPIPDWQQTQWQNILYLDVKGGSLIIFGTGHEQSQILANSSYNLGYNWLSVPARATTLFEVSVLLQYQLSDPESNISDLVLADFATDRLGYRVKCPQLLLEISPTRPLPANAA